MQRVSRSEAAQSRYILLYIGRTWWPAFSIFMLLSMKAVRKAFVLIYPREDWVWLEQYLPQDSVKGESLWTTQQVPREIVQVVNSLQWRSDHSLFCLGHWVWWKLEDPVIHCLISIRHRTTPKRLPTSRPFPSFVELSAFSIADFLHHSSPKSCDWLLQINRVFPVTKERKLNRHAANTFLPLFSCWEACPLSRVPILIPCTPSTNCRGPLSSALVVLL